ncbi:hypothetical protein Xbed_01125 [Xenorhabdus beddingii]|uniref:Uncharacterized protein n=1 Tax=Xenorhabdus beddingii TaxID=40578 RepID=A0A1Y2SPC5_9GAMM|nr:hypothetical protein Xbed_01125 [Xenorhabdus beddingii]
MRATDKEFEADKNCLEAEKDSDCAVLRFTYLQRRIPRLHELLN